MPLTGPQLKALSNPTFHPSPPVVGGTLGKILAGIGVAAGTIAIPGLAAADLTAGEAAGAAGAAGTAEGAAAGAAGGSAASKITSTVTGNLGKIAGGLTITALLTSGSLWKGVAMTLAGAILVFLALRQVAT